MPFAVEADAAVDYAAAKDAHLLAVAAASTATPMLAASSKEKLLAAELLAAELLAASAERLRRSDVDSWALAVPSGRLSVASPWGEPIAVCPSSDVGQTNAVRRASGRTPVPIHGVRRR